ncbi:PIG-L deacetylase family protein [Pelagibacterium luteolum]|uniref:N-acetylglucosaminyl deacetylase, LmbE family n=1 Tax=Pelagibacterium luteolum TaxID=440168 RepID=A0A1G7VF33_9HYPH|nr:PIG-L deacetylase family protein [Pelagibacterium luteolum]SDG58425.1 N-acetylglucosaminyl deacetylase, LmbE family [Pelagibacterium luteolum]
MSLKVMAVGAHPDDIEIYCFGSLAAYAAMGAELALVVATDGALGGADPKALRLLRLGEARVAAQLLDTEPVFLDFPDGSLVCDGPLVAALKREISSFVPDLIITHADNDYHGDHRALSQAVHLAASFSAPVLEMDTLRGTGFVPTHYVDISAHSDVKTAAIRAHQSQDPERFVAASEDLARRRAAECNHLAGMAEAFAFSPRFPFADIRDLLPPAPPVTPVARRDRT